MIIDFYYVGETYLIHKFQVETESAKYVKHDDDFVYIKNPLWERGQFSKYHRSYHTLRLKTEKQLNKQMQDLASLIEVYSTSNNYEEFYANKEKYFNKTVLEPQTP